VRLTSPLATHAVLTRSGREFLPVPASAAEVFEAFSLVTVVRTDRHVCSLSRFAGRLHLRVAPAGEHPAAWLEIPPPRRTDGSEVVVGSLAAFGEHVLVGANDAARGFELFRLAHGCRGADLCCCSARPAVLAECGGPALVP
jgi:hypothetical protein